MLKRNVTFKLAATLTSALVAASAFGLTAQARADNADIQSRPDQLAEISGFPTEGSFIDNIAALPGFYQNSAKNAANAEANASQRYVDRNGFVIQPVPDDGTGWNNTYLNGENRGCTSCHTLENALMSLPTYHRLIFFGYPTEQTFENCIACHSTSYSGRHLGDTLHTIHLESDAFINADNGNCQSCHYINYVTGEFQRWDEVKYDVYRGIVKVDADTADLALSYDQTTVTPPENRYYKTIIDEPSEWLTDDANVDESIYENWVISIDGDCANPVEMTLPEMEEQFGTVTQVMKNDCTINGVGQATIMQVEVEGIPISAIIDYAQPLEGANIMSPISSDGYNYAEMSLDWLIENDAIIVTRMDGKLLPNSQGYPCQLCVYNTSGGNFVKRLSNLTFMTHDPDTLMNQVYVGQFTDDQTGEIYSKPNSAVLSAPTGVVIEGTDVHLEGMADAWDEPIASIEFSLDGGATWTAMDTPDNDSRYWTYWRLDFKAPQAGSYVLKIRTTSITPEGDFRVCQYDTNFLFTVDEA